MRQLCSIQYSSLSYTNNFDDKTGIKIICVDVKSKEDGSTVDTLIFNHDYSLTIKINLRYPIKLAAVLIKIHNQLGVLISTICSPEEGIEKFTFEEKTKVKPNKI